MLRHSEQSEEDIFEEVRKLIEDIRVIWNVSHRFADNKVVLELNWFLFEKIETLERSLRAQRLQLMIDLGYFEFEDILRVEVDVNMDDIRGPDDEDIDDEDIAIDDEQENKEERESSIDFDAVD